MSILTRSRAWMAIAVWLLGLAAFIFVVERHARPASSLEPLWAVPAFDLVGVSAQGQARLRQQDLLGHPWVADFIFTSCGGPCPLMSGKMEALQRILPPDVRLVSFSVDPDHDAPTVLQAYAAHYHADPRRWVFVRGDKETMYTLISKGFRLAVGERPNDPAATRVLHSLKFVVVDADGMIRRFYDSSSGTLFDDLRRDVRQLETVRR